MRRTPVGGRPLAKRPFQGIQVDFVELPQVQKYKDLLVIVDQLTHCVEAFPTPPSTAKAVTKVILKHKIPRYCLILTVDSNRGCHFTSNVLQNIMETLKINWILRTPWHPQSSGRVEQMNQTLKNILTKLIIETRMNWVKCLPLALLRIRTKPRSDIGASPYEMMFGLLFPVTCKIWDCMKKEN